MSFGWSVGDILSGLKVVWDVYQAVSDGPLNAKFEATQFFDEFTLIVSRLSEWEKRKSALPQDDRLAQSHEQLRELCTVFIRRHMLLIQHANPQTKAIRPRRSNWLQKVEFTKIQVLTLYELVKWPAERDEVQRLREKLMLFLHLAAFDIQMATHGMVSEIRASNADLLSSNLKLVSSHLDLVSLVSLNLKRVTYPLEPGRQAKEIDYPMLRQFEQALRPPRPLAAIEAPPRQVALPWQTNGQNQHEKDADYASVTRAAHVNQNGGRFDQNEVRGLISQRLDNLSMRVKRVDTLETISESGPSEGPNPAVVSLLQRLRDMRDQISDAVGVFGLNGSSQDGLPLAKADPEAALRQELEAWNKLEERIEREILHPPRRNDFNDAGPSTSTTPTKPIDIPKPPRRSTTSSSSSPATSPFNVSGSWGATLKLSPPSPMLRPRRNSRSLSTSSESRPESVLLKHEFPVHLYYLDHVISAVIQSIARFDDGEVKSISAISQNGLIKIRHSVEPNAPANIETSMKPFLDNGHVDKSHKLRVQFKGSHSLKITTMLEPQGEKVLRLQVPPVYKFHNPKDYTDFQSLLLNKDLKASFDVQHIKSTSEKDIQCRLGTIRILLEPFTRTRSILYFRHTADQKPGFVEWPVDLFKEPKEPSRKSKSLTLESQDGRVLSGSKSLSRRSTQGSISTVATFESSAAPAFARIQERANKGVKGLIVEFHEPGDCHAFWNEFTIKEPLFSTDVGLGLDLSPTHSNHSPP
ncbi:hypothetical protein L207DRAFT_591702 [Hyaloscypha variabilis F]|uniref:Uncharacterized protein n=1 Tax=Hyaloscypha variabilis (strain UAMH 11265 / GT02V1 / F) TaxID=1149755 RepID=A0A2J6QY96_HYAVF|nr:hypothetical protein L207DRAFT_591702 [Hyaloscypha variabilis F]